MQIVTMNSLFCFKAALYWSLNILKNFAKQSVCQILGEAENFYKERTQR
jgi:hypothetical protein